MSDDQLLSDDIFNSPSIYHLTHSIRILTLAECSSTQKLLLDWWEKQILDLNFTPVLYCPKQLQGIGQKNRTWVSNPGSLTFSFITPVHEMLSLTPLELALLCRNFLFETFQVDLKLKWPNDLVDLQNKKYGGILCHSRRKQVVAGIGLNLFFLQDKNLEQFQTGYIFDKKIIDNFSFLLQLVEYITTHRYSDSNLIIQDWLKHCSHLNKFIKLEDDSQQLTGIFLGLGKFGEALVKDQNEKIHQITNGSFTIY